jgi:hypothetical protein
MPLGDALGVACCRACRAPIRKLLEQVHAGIVMGSAVAACRNDLMTGAGPATLRTVVKAMGDHAALYVRGRHARGRHPLMLSGPGSALSRSV